MDFPAGKFRQLRPNFRIHLRGLLLFSELSWIISRRRIGNFAPHTE